VNGASPTVVDRLHEDFAGLLAVLDGAGEVSLRTVADENFRKSLLLAAASYFERRMTESVLTFVEEATNRNGLIAALVRNKAVSRQYHTWFEWKGSNANSFFGLFGNGFRDFMKARIRRDGELNDSVRAFLELGRERNRLVHQDFGAVPLEKTTEEIHALYRRAMLFVETVPTALREFDPDPV
jgi:hypothetical protein